MGINKRVAKMPVNWQRSTRRVLLHVGVIAGAIFFVFPFYWLITTSVKADKQLFVFPPILFPNPIEFFHYAEVFKTIPLMSYFGNTTFLTVLNIIGSLFSCSLVAFAFARYEVPGSKYLFALLLATMMLPGQVTMIPIFIIFHELGWIGSYKPLWVPAFLGNAFSIFLLRQFFKSIPSEIFDAARVDGCSEFGQYWRIMLPLSAPALATVAIFSFQGTWNDFLYPLIYINDPARKTLSLGLQDFYKMGLLLWQQLMAASFLMVIPVLLVFFFFQRFFIQGIAVTGLKE
jgi:multiple sugar transport system permease protein